VPGDVRAEFPHAAQARQVLNDAEEDLRDWEPRLEAVESQAQGMGNNLMPAEAQIAERGIAGQQGVPGTEQSVQSTTDRGHEGAHLHEATTSEIDTTASEMGSERTAAGTAV
jgi:hypothetical protein